MRIFLLLVFVFVTLAVQNTAGAKSTLSKKGLVFIRDVAYKMVEDYVHNKTIELPDVTGNSSVPVIGRVFFNVTKITLKNIHIVLPELTILPNYGVSFVCTRITGLVEFHFSYTNRGMVRGSGRGRVNLRRMSFQMKLGMAVQDGHPQLSTRDLAFRIHDWTLDLQGPGWFIQLMKSIFSGTIKTNVERSVVRGINDAITKEVNPMLKKLPLRQRVANTDLGLDARLGSLVIKDDYVSIPSTAGFYNFKTNEASNMSRRVVPDTIIESKMIYILISDFLPNSAGEIAFKTSLLHVNLTDEMIPSWSPVRLNSSSLTSFVPNLQWYYPNRKLLVQTFALEPPKSDIDSEGLYFDIKGVQKWFAIFPGKQIVIRHAMTLNIGVQFHVKPFFKNGNICGNIPSFHVKLSVKESSIGEIQTIAVFQEMINMAMNYVLLPGINLVLNAGYPIPDVSGFKMHQPLFKFEEHFFSVSSDFCLMKNLIANVTCPN